MIKNEKKKNRYRAGAVGSIYPLAILQSGESGGAQRSALLASKEKIGEVMTSPLGADRSCRPLVG